MSKSIEENGAPAGEKIFIFYNPPMVNRNLGIRRSYINESYTSREGILEPQAADHRVRQQPIAHRSSAHLLAACTSAAARPTATNPRLSRRLSARRTARDRARIARRPDLAVSCPQMHSSLGIDIGSLDACVMAGYPGTIASTWQRAGRAGRRSGSSCAILVASSAPLDQFIVQHPEYFFGSSPEHAHIQPDNLEILVNHLKCAAFELPISPDEKFGNVDVPELCEQLRRAGFLHRAGVHWHWIDEAYPADTISLRSVTSDNFVIIDTTGEDRGKPEVIGEVDFSSRAHDRSSEGDLHPPGAAISR